MIPRIDHQRGFSLIEAMVALLIIAVGLLGIAGMQGLAINSNATSRVRSVAALEAASMVAMMRANNAYWGANAASASVSSGVLGGNATLVSLGTSTSSCMNAVCAPAAMAASDLQRWAAGLAAQLPQGSGAVVCTGAPLVCTVTVNWLEKNMALNAPTGTEAGALATATTGTFSYQTVVMP
jgi:type IV pilus assembly protein PilV